MRRFIPLALMLGVTGCRSTVCDTAVLEGALQTEVEVTHAEAIDLPPEIPSMGWFRPDDPPGCLLRYRMAGVDRLAVTLPAGKDDIRVHPLEGTGPIRTAMLFATSRRRPRLLVSHRRHNTNGHMLQVDLYALGRGGDVSRETIQVVGAAPPVLHPPTYPDAARTGNQIHTMQLRIDADGVNRYWCVGWRRRLAPCAATTATSADPG